MLCVYPIINAVLMSAVTDAAEQRTVLSRNVLMVSPFSKEEASSRIVNASQGRKTDTLEYNPPLQTVYLPFCLLSSASPPHSSWFSE